MFLAAVTYNMQRRRDDRPMQPWPPLTRTDPQLSLVHYSPHFLPQVTPTWRELDRVGGAVRLSTTEVTQARGVVLPHDNLVFTYCVCCTITVGGYL